MRTLVIGIFVLSSPCIAELSASTEEFCFSPDQACGEKLIQFATSAKTSVDIAIYDINLDKLVHDLLSRQKKIHVRIIVDKRQAKGSHSLVTTLKKAGAQIRYGHQRGIMHDKFMIVDGERLETGSFNYTNHASQANQENQVYLSTPRIVTGFKDRFEKMWLEGQSVENEK